MAQIQYFLGANSPSGFYSLYHELMPAEEAKAIYILKGGPGCGKSSFLRRVARHAEAAGRDTVLIQCSGDPGSLDGLILPGLSVALADGTAPHIIEPQYPGAVESYVDLGVCYDREALVSLRESIVAATQAHRDCYNRVWHCLSAAGQLRRDDRELLLTGDTSARLAKRAEGVIRREIKKGGGQTGRIRRRFLSTLTCQGQLRLDDTVSAQSKRVFELQDSYGLAHDFLAPICSAAAGAGWDVTACPDPMAPDRLAHLIIPGLSLAFVSTHKELPWPQRPYRRLRLDAMTDQELYRTCRSRLRFSRKVSSALEHEAAQGLARAKEAHDRLEALYNPHVDFDRVYRMADDLAFALL